MRMRSILLPALLPSLVVLLGGCPASTPKDEGGRTAELADKLVSCQNERSSLKEQLGAAEAQVRQLKSEAAAAPAAPQAEAAVPRAGRAAPHGASAARETARPAVRRGPDNPEAEARAAKEMAQLLRAQAGQLRPCYERGLKRNANLQFVSQINVRLTVNPDGHARDVRTSPRTDPDMESCIAQLASRWSVTPYKGQPVQVELPVSLKVQGQ